jgi:hypothetical protein
VIVAGLFDVEDFSLKRKDGLEAAVAALFGGTAGALALDQEQLAARGILLLAIGEFAGQAAGIECALAAGEVAGLAGGFARTRGFNRLADDLAADGGVLVEVLAELLVDELRHEAGDIAVELALGLAFELGLRNLYAYHRGQAFADVVAGETFFFLEEALGLSECVDGARQGGTETGEMGTAIHGVDVVGEAQLGYGIAIVVLQRHFHGERSGTVGQFPIGFEVDGLLVQHLFAAVQVADELGDAAGIDELGGLLGVDAFIGERDLQTLVEESQLAEALRQRVVVEHALRHDGGIGFESDARAGFAPGFADLG